MSASKAKRHLSRVAALGCILCDVLGRPGTPAEIHHPRIQLGGAQRASDWVAIPLCPLHCHRGPHGVHGDKQLLKQAKVTEMDLLAMVIERLVG